MPEPISVLIDLTKVRDAQAYDEPNEIIQQDTKSEFFDQVNDSLKYIDGFVKKLNSENSYERIRHHDTITISGSRGSGKTTFILNMFKLLNTDEIEILGILDPTLIEDKEHVFVNIISRIKKVVDQRRDGRCDPVANSYCPKHTDSCDSSGNYQDWLSCLRSLAEGLPSLDGVGSDDLLKSEQWHDPVHVLEKGLKIATASNDLEVLFHKFLHKSLKMLEKKAFIIAFDDIDTKFPAGWPVLETIRKYLTSPQLITVLSGDLSLYSKLVRKQQWENFGETLLKEERDEKKENDQYSRMVDQLEDQYLLKVLKPEKRLELRTLEQLLSNGYQIAVQRSNDDEIKPALSVVVDAMFRFCHRIAPLDFKNSNGDLALYRNAFFQEPVRTVIQLVFGYLKAGNDSKKFINTLTNTFLVSLQQYGFSSSFAKQPDSRVILNQLVQKFTEKKILERGYRLKAEFEEVELNRLMWVLGAVIVELFRTCPELYFEYLIKVGLSREMALRLPVVGFRNKITLPDYLDWVGITDGEDSMTISRMASGPMRIIASVANKNTRPMSSSRIRHISDAEKQTTHVGTVLIRTFDPNKGKKLSIENKRLRDEISQHYQIDVDAWHGHGSLLEYVFNTKGVSNPYAYEFTNACYQAIEYGPLCIDNQILEPNHKAYYGNSLEELENNITSWHKYFVNIPAQRLVNRNGETKTVYSIHCLLAFIGEMIQTQPEDLEKSIVDFSQLRDYPWPSWDEETAQTSVVQNDQKIDEEDFRTHTDIPVREDVLNGLNKWKEDFKKTAQENPLPPHIWAKVFTRFYYSLQRLDQSFSPENRYLGNIMHRSIVLFFNAVLVEEALYRNCRQKVNIKNPTTTDKVFIDNINKFIVSKDWKESTDSRPHLYEELPFFSRIVTFPIWHIFMNLSAERNFYVDYALTHYMGGEKEDLCTYCEHKGFASFYILLNSVTVLDQKPLRTHKGSKPSSQYPHIPVDNIPLLVELIEKHNGNERKVLNEYYKEYRGFTRVPSRSKEKIDIERLINDSSGGK